MRSEELKTLYAQHLRTFVSEIEQYSNEEAIWKIDAQILNSGGNLVLHLVGNLNHFIGAIIGESGYVRDRDKEFSEKNVSKSELLLRARAASEIVDRILSNMEDDQFDAAYPSDKFGEGRSNGYVLTYLLAHLAWHNGQLNYHRRLLDRSA